MAGRIRKGPGEPDVAVRLRSNRRQPPNDQRSPVACRSAAIGRQLPRGRAERWRWWFYLLVLVVAPFTLLLAAVLAVYLWWQLAEARAAHEVGLEIARIQASGEPVTIYDLYAYHQVPQGRADAAKTWFRDSPPAAPFQLGHRIKICRSFERDRLTTRTFLAADVPGSRLELAERFLAKNDAAVQAGARCRSRAGRMPVSHGIRDGRRSADAACSRGPCPCPADGHRMRVWERGDNEAAVQSLEAIAAEARGHAAPVDAGRVSRTQCYPRRVA